MGLSTKQVSSDGLDWGESFNFQSSGLVELSRWRQSRIYQPDPLPCPRCCSKNTKFCYYNNYNKSQPRHFCKACKRHWTKGGILRNVPVGGGRKKKRLKTSATSVTSIAMESQIHQQSQNLSLALGDQNDTFRILSQGSFSNMGNNVNSHFSDNHISSFPLSHNPVPPFTFSSLGPFEIEGNSTPLNGDHNLVWPASLEDEITIMPSISCFTSPTWHAPTTGTGIDVPSCWNWYDVNPLVTADQLNINWDDTHEIKP